MGLPTNAEHPLNLKQNPSRQRSRDLSGGAERGRGGAERGEDRADQRQV